MKLVINCITKLAHQSTLETKPCSYLSKSSSFIAVFMVFSNLVCLEEMVDTYLVQEE